MSTIVLFDEFYIIRIIFINVTIRVESLSVSADGPRSRESMAA